MRVWSWPCVMRDWCLDASLCARVVLCSCGVVLVCEFARAGARGGASSLCPTAGLVRPPLVLVCTASSQLCLYR